MPATDDISLAATIDFSPATAGADPHRKAVLMIRQSLDPNSPYADACIHGNGLTAIQWRDTEGEATYETQAQANAPKRVLIEKRGDYLSMSFGSSDKDLQPAGGACKVQFTGDMYIGLGVCAQRRPHREGRLFRCRDRHARPDHRPGRPRRPGLHAGNHPAFQQGPPGRLCRHAAAASARRGAQLVGRQHAVLQ